MNVGLHMFFLFESQCFSFALFVSILYFKHNFVNFFFKTIFIRICHSTSVMTMTSARGQTRLGDHKPMHTYSCVSNSCMLTAVWALRMREANIMAIAGKCWHSVVLQFYENTSSFLSSCKFIFFWLNARLLFERPK